LIDLTIIEGCQHKDQHAFRTLYETCLPYVFRIVNDYIPDEDFRKDLVQEVFAKVFLNISGFDPQRGEFRFWLRKITVNQCRMFLRKEDHLEVSSDLESSMHPTVSIDLRGLDPDLTEELLEKMPQGYREVFRLVVLKGLSHGEVGTQLGISQETSRSQLSRAKNWLRDYLQSTKNMVPYGLI
jgi:RNA polymerase sigma factor (sigma-70 family)